MKKTGSVLAGLPPPSRGEGKRSPSKPPDKNDGEVGGGGGFFRMVAAVLFFSTVLLANPSHSQDQILNSFEAADIGEWTVLTGETLVGTTGGICWRDGTDQGDLTVTGAPFSGIGLDASLEVPPSAGNRYLAVDACYPPSGQMALGITSDGFTWYYSTQTTFGPDNTVDANDVLWFDLGSPLTITAPVSIKILDDGLGGARVYHLDTLRYTNDVSVGNNPTPTPTPTHTPTPCPLCTSTYTVTYSPTVTFSATRSNTLTRSETWTSTFTSTPTPTWTPTVSPTPPFTFTVSPTFTISPTPTITPATARPPMVYPNPWRVGQTRGVYITRLRKGDSIRVYTVDGILVRSLGSDELTNEGGKNPIMGKIWGTDGRGDNDYVWRWDGKNDVGNNVATGLYLAVVNHKDGGRDTAKIAIIR